MSKLYKELANCIRFLSIDAVQKANSGHPGMPMGMADVATVLFKKFLKVYCEDPNWPDRDRFILSAGHGSMLIYAFNFLSGYKDPHSFQGFPALVDNASTSAMYYPCDEEIVLESKWQHRCTYQETCVADMDAWNDHDVREDLKNIRSPIFLFKG